MVLELEPTLLRFGWNENVFVPLEWSPYLAELLAEFLAELVVFLEELLQEELLQEELLQEELLQEEL